MTENSMSERSKHNIFSGIKGSADYFLVNVLSGNADILDAQSASLYINGDACADNPDFAMKGYISQPEDEQKSFRNAYLDFIDGREQDELQLFFVPWYFCNFNCRYCYQSGYEKKSNRPDNIKDIIDAFYKYISANFAAKKKYITLFGGEPLLEDAYSKEAVLYFLEKAATNKLDVAVVTNGYSLAGYIDILKFANIREIQVTLDGTAAMHDSRRQLRDGRPSFEKIVEGIDAALSSGFSINLRVVLDRENIAELAELAKFAAQKGWTEHPKFKTQLGRNYELHSCMENNGRLFSRLEMADAVFAELKKEPGIEKFHRPAFALSAFLHENGKLPEPVFDSCPGCKTEWAFDYTGKIFACTATVGKEGEELGKFYPEAEAYLEEQTIAEWQERDITSIQECKNCNVSLVCGGGCAAVAKNSTGRLLAPDCRPVKELLELGMKRYFIDKAEEEDNAG
jgi:uncharacterized protein